MCNDFGMNSNSEEWKSAEFADGLGTSSEKKRVLTLQSSDKRYAQMFERQDQDYRNQLNEGTSPDERKPQIIEVKEDLGPIKVRVKGDEIIERLYQKYKGEDWRPAPKPKVIAYELDQGRQVQLQKM